MTVIISNLRKNI